MLSHTAQNSCISRRHRMIDVCLRNFHRHGKKERKVHGAHCPQKIRKHDIRILQIVAVQHGMIEVFPHQKVIDRQVMILKEIKHPIPLHFVIQDQTAQCMVFLPIQACLMPLIDTSPVCILQIKLIHLCHILRQLIGKFPTQLPTRDDCKQDEFLFRKCLNDTVHPARHAADHIGITSFCYDADSHTCTSSPSIRNNKALSSVSV